MDYTEKAKSEVKDLVSCKIKKYLELCFATAPSKVLRFICLACAKIFSDKAMKPSITAANFENFCGLMGFFSKIS